MAQQRTHVPCKRSTSQPTLLTITMTVKEREEVNREQRKKCALRVEKNSYQSVSLGVGEALGKVLRRDDHAK